MMQKKGSYDAEKGHNGDFNPPKDWFMDKQRPLFVEYRKKVQDTDANAVEAIARSRDVSMLCAVVQLVYGRHFRGAAQN